MNADIRIDLLRRTNYMRIDKASEIIAAQYCFGIHYHRYLVLEGVRCAALRNVGRSDSAQSNSIVDAGAARLFSRKYNEPVEVILDDLNRICRKMYGIFKNSLWEVYLCLLYEELEAYRKLVKKNSNFGHTPLSGFLHSNRDLVTHLREFRDRVLHPGSGASAKDALDGSAFFAGQAG